MKIARGVWLSFIGLFGIVLATVPTTVSAQQEAQFTQYLFNGLVINPAYSGYQEVTNINLTYRNQWTGFEGAPMTLSASADGVIDHKNMGLGVVFMNDKLGAQSNFNSYVSYAYRLKINEEARLSFGVALGATQYSLNTGNVTFAQTGDRALAGSKSSRITPDLNAGVYYASDKFFIGGSLTNLLSNNPSNDPSLFIIKNTQHAYLSGGIMFDLSDDVRLKPSFLVKEDFKGPTSIDLNLFVLLRDRIWVGGTYRSGYAIFNSGRFGGNLPSGSAASAALEYFISPSLRIGYSYDYSVTHLQQVSGGTHEISLGYYFRKREMATYTPRYF